MVSARGPSSATPRNKSVHQRPASTQASLVSSSGVALCPPGHYCAAASTEPVPCPPGRFGALPGLTSVACAPPGDTGTLASVCPAGYVCPAGSADPFAIPCGGPTAAKLFAVLEQPDSLRVAHVYGDAFAWSVFPDAGLVAATFCPPGSAAPTRVKRGYYTVGRPGARIGQVLCERGHYCVLGVRHKCPGGTFGACCTAWIPK